MWNTLFPPYKPNLSEGDYVPPHVQQRLLEKGHWVPDYAEGTFLVWASDWMIANLQIPAGATLIYLFLIWYLDRTMKNRPAYDLKGPLFVWNVILAGKSTINFKAQRQFLVVLVPIMLCLPTSKLYGKMVSLMIIAALTRNMLLLGLCISV
jgi:hypothetical protein